MHKLEISLYWLLWSGGVLYSLYSFIIASMKYHHQLDPNDFTKGWALNLPKDVSDYEWTALREAFISNYYLIIMHLILTQFVLKFCPKILTLYFAIFSCITIVKILSFWTLLIFLLNIFLTMVIHLFAHKLFCYLIFITILYTIHSPLFSHVKYALKFDEKHSLLLEVSLAWLNAKCLSFAIDRMREDSHRKPLKYSDFMLIMSYCLYFPALYTGPIYQYSSYVNNMKNLPLKWTLNRTYSIINQLFRCAFWALIYELMMHFIYSSSFQYYPELSETLDGWTLCGLGYALTCTFFVKYFVIYGSVQAIASIDGFEMPDPPKCISRIHLCTFLWRYFDRGLHLWLTNYFYKPLIGSNWSISRRIIAGFLCFSCVCLWHGMDAAIMAWSTLNFLGVSIELIANAADSSQLWTKIKRNLSLNNQLRLNAALASPFFAIAFISNIFFLSNWDVGWCFVRRTMFSFPIPTVPTLFFMYVGAHVSMSYREKELKYINKRHNHSF